MADIKLTPELEAIFLGGKIEGDKFYLPEGQLDPKTYGQVKKFVELCGGKWKTSAKAFVFAAGNAKVLEAAVMGGEKKDEKKALQAFYTPVKIAQDVAQKASLRGMKVLEPSAGSGRLVRACLEAGAVFVNAVEINGEEMQNLEDTGANVVYKADFLSLDPQEVFCHYDRVVMNPPYTKNQDIKHVKHALKFLRSGGRLLAIMPDKDYTGKLPSYTVLAKYGEGEFRESGTNIRTQLIEIVA